MIHLGYDVSHSSSGIFIHKNSYNKVCISDNRQIRSSFNGVCSFSLQHYLQRRLTFLTLIQGGEKITTVYQVEYEGGGHLITRIYLAAVKPVKTIILLWWLSKFKGEWSFICRMFSRHRIWTPVTPDTVSLVTWLQNCRTEIHCF